MKQPKNTYLFKAICNVLDAQTCSGNCSDCYLCDTQNCLEQLKRDLQRALSCTTVDDTCDGTVANIRFTIPEVRAKLRAFGISELCAAIKYGTTYVWCTDEEASDDVSDIEWGPEHEMIYLWITEDRRWGNDLETYANRKCNRDAQSYVSRESTYKRDAIIRRALEYAQRNRI